MAYKFQLGSARLSGSIVLNEDLEVAGTTALAAGQIDANELASDAVTTVKILDANVTTAKIADSNVTTAKIADSNVTTAKIADSNVTTAKIANDAVTGAKIVADAVDSQHIALGALDSEHYSSGSIENGHLAGNIANDKLVNSTISGIALGSNLNSISAAADGAITFTSYNGSAAVSDVSVQVDGTTLAKASNALKIADGGVDSLQIADDAVDSQHIALGALDSEHYSTGSIESNHLAGAIANDKLANSTVSYGGVQLSLGGSDSTPAFNLSDASAYPGDSSLVTVGALDAGSITSNFGSINVGSSAISTTGTGSFGKLVVSGDLEVSGDLTYVNTTNLAISDALITIGSGSSAFATGYGIEFGAMGDSWASLETATIGSDNVLSSSLGLAAPAVLANQFYGQLVGSFQMSVESLSNGGTMEVGKVYQVDNIASEGSFSIAMPSGASQGDVVRVKCQAIASGEKLTLTSADGFDGGVGQIYLESDYAAVMFIYDGTEWMVF